MDTYLVMLLVTAEQEGAIQYLFGQHGWKYCKTGSRAALKGERDMLMEHKTTNVFSATSYSAGMDLQHQQMASFRNPVLQFGVQDLSRSSTLSFHEMYPANVASAKPPDTSMSLSERPLNSSLGGYQNSSHASKMLAPLGGGSAGEQYQDEDAVTDFSTVETMGQSEMCNLQTLGSATSVAHQVPESHWQNNAPMLTVTPLSIPTSSSSSSVAHTMSSIGMVEPVQNQGVGQLSNIPLKPTEGYTMLKYYSGNAGNDANEMKGLNQQSIQTNNSIHKDINTKSDPTDIESIKVTDVDITCNGLWDTVGDTHAETQEIDKCFTGVYDVIRKHVLMDKDDDSKIALMEAELGKMLELLASARQTNINTNNATSIGNDQVLKDSTDTLKHDVSDHLEEQLVTVNPKIQNKETRQTTFANEISPKVDDKSLIDSDSKMEDDNEKQNKWCEKRKGKSKRRKVSRKREKKTIRLDESTQKRKKSHLPKGEKRKSNRRKKETEKLEKDTTESPDFKIKDEPTTEIEGINPDDGEGAQVKSNSNVHHRWTVNRNLRMHTFHRKPEYTPDDLDEENYSISNNGYYCKDCRFIFNGKHKLTLHKELKGNYCSPDCIYCDKDEESKDIFQCSKCHKCFSTKELLEQHEEKHDPNAFICKFCEAGFYTVADMKQHIQIDHKEESQVTFLCDLCGSKFLEKKVLVAHRKYVHTDERPEKCPSCSCRFKTKSQLKNHEVVHKNLSDLNLSCEVCGKMFARAGTLKEHVRRHKKEFTFFCPLCNKGFYREYGMKEHMRIHTGVKPFTCKICGYKCALGCNLSKHMRTHQKPWKHDSMKTQNYEMSTSLNP